MNFKIINQSKIIILLLLFGSIFARDLYHGSENNESNLYRSARPEKAFLIHQTGNLWSAVTNFGSVGDPDYDASGRPSAAWPAGSGNSYLYDSGFWVGSEMGGVPILKTYFYNYDEKEWLPTAGFPGEIGSNVAGEKSKSLEDSYVVFDDLDSETISGQQALGVKIIRRGLTWGLPDYDDFIALEYAIINTGLNGDLEDVFCSYWYDIDVSGSDATDRHIDDLVDYDGWDGNNSDSDILDIVDPYDLDDDGETGYDEWGIPYGKDPGHNPNYTLANTESDGFYDEWTLLIDPDGETVYWQTNGGGGIPGEPAVVDGDTLRGWLFPRSCSYIYDADNATSSGNDYGERDNPTPNEGFLGGNILYTEAAWNVHENGESYMGAYAHQWWNWESDPGSDEERWAFMRGQHSTSGGMRYLKNPNELGYPEFDYRFLLTTGPIDIAEGDTIKIVYILANGTGLQGLRTNLDNAARAYYSGSNNSDPYNPSAFDEDIHWNLPIPPLTPDLSYSPLNNGMRLAWDSGAEYSWDANLNSIDFEGYQIYRALYNPQDWQMIMAFDNVDEEVFVVDAFGDTLNEKIGGNWVKINLPHYEDYANSYDDEGGNTDWGLEFDQPVNGLPYFYTLAAYDGYKSPEEAGQEILPSYSPLSNYKKTPAGAAQPVYPGRLYETGEDILPLDDIAVVPNPYRGTALWEKEFEDRIQFTYLPPLCKISIFSLSGDLVKEIDHTDGTDCEYWDLISLNGQSVVSGIYIFVVEAPDVKIVGESSSSLGKFVGKFVVFR